jgi:hypothetical protein
MLRPSESQHPPCITGPCRSKAPCHGPSPDFCPPTPPCTGHKGNAIHLPVSCPPCQFSLTVPTAILHSLPAQGGNMNDFISWAQSNWYEAGILFIALAFLVAGVWFARNILRTTRAFQEQLGALLKLSITTAPSELQTGVHAKRSLAEASPYWLTSSVTETVAPPESPFSAPSQSVPAWRRLLLWLNEPMATSEVGRWRRAMRWLQAPAGN